MYKKVTKFNNTKYIFFKHINKIIKGFIFIFFIFFIFNSLLYALDKDNTFPHNTENNNKINFLNLVEENNFNIFGKTITINQINSRAGQQEDEDDDEDDEDDEDEQDGNQNGEQDNEDDEDGEDGEDGEQDDNQDIEDMFSSEELDQLEKLKEILMNMDYNTILEIAEALNIEYSEGEEKESIIDKILKRLEIIPKSTEESKEETEETSVVEESFDRTNIPSILSGAFYHIDFDYIALEKKEMNGKMYDRIITFGNCKITYENTILYADLLIVNNPEKEKENEGETDDTQNEGETDDTQNEGETTNDTQNEGETDDTQNEGETTNDKTEDEEEKSEERDIEVMACGNIKVEAESNVFIAELAFFYSHKLRTILYDVVAYFPESSTFILKADIVKLLSGTDEMIGIDISATTSYIEFPHYKFTGDKIWYYPETENFFITNMTFQIGQTTLLYFPFMYQSQFSSGISTDFRYLRGLGFYVQTTAPFDIFGYKNRLIFDYYQKMGLYFSLVNDIELLGMNISVAAAYDRAVQYVGNLTGRHIEIFSNDIWLNVNGEDVHIGNFNSFRYYLNITSPIAIYTGEAVDLESTLEENGNLDILDALSTDQIKTLGELVDSLIANLSSSGNISFFKVSDPLFESQFMSFPRSEIFDIGETIDYREYAPTTCAPTGPGSNTTAMKIDSSITMSTTGISLLISGNWVWTFKSKIGEMNYYDVLNYYDIQMSSFTFPYITFGFNSSISDNLIDNFLWLFFKIIDPEKEFVSLSEEFPELSLNLPLSYTFNFMNSPTQTFVTDTTSYKETEADAIDNAGEKSLDKTIRTTSFSYSLPFSLSYSFFSFSLGMSYSLSHYYQSTLIDINKEPDEIIKDDIDSTKFSWSWSLSNSMSFSFFQEYEYLSINLNFSTSFSKSGTFNDLMFQMGLSDTEYGESMTNSYSGSNVLNLSPITLSFLKTSISFTGLTFPLSLSDDDLKQLGNIETMSFEYDGTSYTTSVFVDREYLFEEKKSGSYVLSLSSTLVNNLSISFSYSEKNKLDAQDYYYMTLGGRGYVIENFGYPSLFGGKGDSSNIGLSYKIDFAEMFYENEELTNELNISSSFTHYFGNVEYKDDYMTFGTTYTLNLEQLLFNTFLINALTVNTSLSHYFDDEKIKQDALTITLSLDLDITSLWSLNVSYSVENKSLWRYTSVAVGNERRYFFADLWMALSIWDLDSLLNTSWKVKGLSFYLYHDLAEWEMSIGITILPRLVNNVLIIEPQISLSIVLIGLPEFSGGESGKGTIDHFIYDRY